MSLLGLAACAGPVTAGDAQQVFDARCLACHAGPFAPEGLDLTDAHAATVGVPSSQVPTMDRVTPFEPEQSYLWLKVQGRGGEVGGSPEQMPFDGTAPLSAPELAIIEAWILDGALAE